MTIGDGVDMVGEEGQPDYADEPDTKMCPFLSGFDLRRSGSDKHFGVKCRKEFCTFWDKEQEKCKILIALNGINNLEAE